MASLPAIPLLGGALGKFVVSPLCSVILLSLGGLDPHQLSSPSFHPPDTPNTPDVATLASFLPAQLSDPTLRKALEGAPRHVRRLSSLRDPVPLNYGIFRTGCSALRSLPTDVAHLLESVERLATTEPICDIRSLHRSLSILLFLQSQPDAAHEIILGVTSRQISQAEYAATHPGQTDWMETHPLTTTADLIHATLHRFEGSVRGEGNHTGYENAKFWLGGGPKELESPAEHPVRTELAEMAREVAPRCVEAGLVASEDSRHEIIAGGGKMRTITVPRGQWDGFVFCDLCRDRIEGKVTRAVENELVALVRLELEILLRWELKEAFVGEETNGEGHCGW